MFIWRIVMVILASGFVWAALVHQDPFLWGLAVYCGLLSQIDFE